MGYLTGRDNTYLLSLINNDDATGTLADDARRELARRGALPDWAQAPAIDSPIADAPDSLESAASPISVEPIAGVHVNGVTVPPVMGADGRPLGDGQYYRVRDVKNAQAAAQEAQMSAEWDRQAKDDMAAYGTRQLFRESDQIDPKTGYPVVEPMPSTGPAPGMDLTPEGEEQQKRLGARRAAEARTRDSHAYRRAQAIRMGESAGISPLEAAALLAQPKGQAQLSMMGASRAAERRMEARDRVRENAIRAGGSTNVGLANRWILNNLADMPKEERDRQLRYMMPGGRLAAEVDAKNNEQLSALGLRVAQGQGFQQMDPVQREALEQRVDEGKPVQVRAQKQVAAGNLNHPDVQAHAENIVATTYSSAPGVLGISSDFTDNEVALAAQRLADDTGMDLENALAMMRRIQAERRRNSLASSVVAWFYDQ